MFKEDRLSKIKNILLRHKQVDVQTLSRMLKVSNVTVRSDLEILEKEQFLTRTHGGAVLCSAFSSDENNADDPLIPENITLIAQIASLLIANNDWIFLGSGIECFALAKELQNLQHLNIITNNIEIAHLLSESYGINLIVSGGSLFHSKKILSGDIFDQSIQNLRVNKVFCTVSGIDIDYGLTVDSLQEHNVFQTIKKIGSELIIVVDNNNFGKVALKHVCNLPDVSAIVTSEDIPEKYKTYCFDNKIRLYTSYDIQEYLKE